MPSVCVRPPLGTLTRYIKDGGGIIGHSHNGKCREHVLYFSIKRKCIQYS